MLVADVPEYYVGVMSGTSLDGVDSVVVEKIAGPRFVLRAHCFEPFSQALRQEVLALHKEDTPCALRRAQKVAVAMAQLYSQSIRALLTKAGYLAQQIVAAGCHGQTICHDPKSGFSYQLLQAARVVEETGIDVVCDVRNRDICAGGQGAPLAPAFHALLASKQGDCAVLNVGGFANITILHQGRVMGFDVGPAAVLLDAWIWLHKKERYDHNGQWAASGIVSPVLLARLLAHPFFSQTPPKSTGRHDFNLAWLHSIIGEDSWPAEDVQRTLVACLVVSVQHALACYRITALFLCGGGAHNGFLHQCFTAALSCTVHTTAVLGMAPECVEGAAFAWLAHQTVHRQPASVPAATGARGPRILGAIYPK